MGVTGTCEKPRPNNLSQTISHLSDIVRATSFSCKTERNLYKYASLSGGMWGRSHIRWRTCPWTREVLELILEEIVSRKGKNGSWDCQEGIARKTLFSKTFKSIPDVWISNRWERELKDSVAPRAPKSRYKQRCGRRDMLPGKLVRKQMLEFSWGKHVPYPGPKNGTNRSQHSWIQWLSPLRRIPIIRLTVGGSLSKVYTKIPHFTRV